MAIYRINANYVDPEISIKNVKKEKQDITFANASYHLSVNADDPKKAYDIAAQYLPVNADIYSIERDNNLRYANPEPF